MFLTKFIVDSIFSVFHCVNVPHIFLYMQFLKLKSSLEARFLLSAIAKFL